LDHAAGCEKVVTLDLHESSTILMLKQALLESNQSLIPVNMQCLFLMDVMLNDDLVLLEVLPHGEKSLHIRLICETTTIPLVASVYPMGDDVGLLENVQVDLLHAVNVSSIHHFVEVRTWKDEKCKGTYQVVTSNQTDNSPTAWDDNKCCVAKRIIFTPFIPFIPSTKYVVYVYGGRGHEGAAENTDQSGKKNKFNNYAFSFTTEQLDATRVIARNLRSEKFIILERNSPDLYYELKLKIATRFGLTPNQIVFPSITLKDIILFNDRNNNMVDFEVIEDSHAPMGEIHVHDDVPKLGWKEYVEEHWVNSSAGYYALVGKMSEEEETKLLLEIVAAFSDIQIN